jgi:hypothetical protein
MCRYIVGKIIWEEMQKTLIFKRLKWMRKLKKHRIVQRDAGKRIKKCSEIQSIFLLIQNCIIVENHKLNVHQLVQHLFL